MAAMQPTDEKEVATIRKNAREEIRVKLATLDGRRYVAIRLWFMANRQMVPSKKGVTVEIAKLPALAAALTQALEIAHSERDEGA